MLTGHGEGEAAKRALAQGAFDFLAKPCDVDTLALRILDACQQPAADIAEAEHRVRDVMIPVQGYTKLLESQTIAEGIMELKRSFSPQLHTSSIMETGHRSLLVFDAAGNLKGILAIMDLLEGIMPGYLSAPKPSTADSLQYSPMFWTGMFTREVSQLANTPVGQLMSPTPPTIDADANLMEAAYLMVKNQCRRMVVLENDRLVGVIREQLDRTDGEILQDLGIDTVVTAVVCMPDLSIGIDGIEALFLEAVGSDLVEDSDATTLVRGVVHDDTLTTLCDEAHGFVELRPAVTPQ